MEQPGIVHANTGAGPDAFWRPFMAQTLGAGILTGAALAIVPIALLIAHPNVWMLLPLIVAPLGVWIVVKASDHARKLLWHYSHLPAFTLPVVRLPGGTGAG